MNDFQAQLKVKDEEYVKALKQQAEDVEELLERMRTEFRELQVCMGGTAVVTCFLLLLFLEKAV